MKNSKTPNYQKKASANYKAKKTALGYVRYCKWIKKELIEKIERLIKEDSK